MKLSLIIPPSAFLIDDRAFPFLGPLQIAAVARMLGHSVTVHDLTGYKRRHPEIVHANADLVLADACAELLRGLAEDVELVGFYSLAAQHPHVVSLLATVKEQRPKAVTVIGGPHANTAPERCVQDGFDYVVVSDQGGGGGEAGFIVLLEQLARTKRSLMATNRIIKIPSREGVTWENDKWPLPARDLIDLDSYRYFLNGERCTSIVSATGCPFACTYCSHWEGYRKLEARSSEKVREEIRSIRSVYGIRAFMDYCDEINLRPDFVSEFLPMMRSENIIWRAFFKNGKNLTTDAVFEAMAASGCVQLCTGAESADPAILKAIKKGATLEDNTAFVRLCVKHGIKPKVFTQVGLPGETRESIEALRQWLIAMAAEGLDDADTSITTPYEGTPIWDHPEKHAITYDKDALDFSKDVVLYKGIPGEYKSYVSHPGLSAEDLVEARQMIEDDFRKAAGLKPLLAKDDG